MSVHASSAKKYQVYFFLYLAVICELLIVIVERDDAEAENLRAISDLKTIIERIFNEFVHYPPNLSGAADNTMYVGDEKVFSMTFQGLGEKDQVVRAPRVLIHRLNADNSNGAVVDSIMEVGRPDDNGSRLWARSANEYTFRWVASKGTGRFRFTVDAQTNKVTIRNDSVKVGPLMFDRGRLEAIVGPIDPVLLGSINTQDNSFVIDVVDKGRVAIAEMQTLVTAAGFPVSQLVPVEGTAAESVTGVSTTAGTVLRAKDGTTWSGTFNHAGQQRVTVRAADKSGNAATREFTVDVRRPVMAKPMPEKLYAGESVTMNINVAGLEVASLYAWTVSVAGRTFTGTSPRVDFVVPQDAAGATATIQATYANREYPVLIPGGEDIGASTFHIAVATPPLRVISEPLKNDGEYPNGQEFRFHFITCGNCTQMNRRAIPANEIRVIAETENGRDILEELRIQPGDNGTLVSFRLKAPNLRNEVNAVVELRVAGRTFHYDIILVKD